MPALADVCELIVDCEHKTAPTGVSGFPLIRTPDIGFGRLDVEGANRVDEATYRAWTQRAVPRAGDLILAREAPVGNVGPVPAGVQPVLGQRTVLIRTRPEVLDPIYLNYLLCGPELRNWMLGVASGATLPHLNLADIRSMDLPPLPSLEAQRKIATILAAYDELIDINNRRVNVLEEMAQRIYREWFVDFRYPGHEQAMLVDSELGPIPDGWSVHRLADIAEVTRGLSWDRDQEVQSGGQPVITIPNVQARLHFDGMTRLAGISTADVAKFALAHGDTVLVGSNGNPDRVGQAIYVPRGISVLVASFLMRVRATGSPVGPALLHLQLKDPRLTSAWRSSAIGATSLRNIRLSTLRASPVLVPEPVICVLGENQISALLDRQDALDSHSALLRTLRNLLLPRLLSREIDVTDLDIAVPDLAA